MTPCSLDYQGVATSMEIKERMRAVLEAEAQAIAGIQVDDSFEQAVRMLLDCPGKVVTTGIGKAGHVARRFAATLCSVVWSWWARLRRASRWRVTCAGAA